MSASATTRALPVSTRFDASSVPRPPQPSKPTRTAEFAAVPRTNSGSISIAPAVAAATPVNFPRSRSFEKFDRFASLAIRPPLNCKLSNEFFQVSLRLANIRYLLRAGNLTLNGDCALIIELFQALKNAREIHFAFADGNFLPQVFWIRGKQSVLGVDSLDIRTEELHRVHRIGFAIKNQVCEVKVDALIVETYVLHGTNQCDGRLLSGLVAEILPVVPAIANHFLHCRDRFLINRIVGILGNESAMRLDSRDSALLGEIRGFLDVRNPRRSRLTRN